MTSTRWWRCSRPRRGSATGCPVPAPRCSSTTCSASRSPATSSPLARRPATRPSRCSPRTPARASSGTSCASPASRRASGRDLRMRGSFLGSERLVDLLRPGGEPLPTDVATAATLGRLLDEERRLFYVAVTRARGALLVTAVTSEREGLAPSRFLDEIDPLPAGDDAARRHPGAPAAEPHRPGGRAARRRVEPTPTRPTRCGVGAAAAGWPGWPRPVPAAPTRTVVGAGPAVRRARRPRPTDEPVRGQPVEGRVVHAGASCGGSSSTSAAATRPAPRRTSARSCTRWPRRALDAGDEHRGGAAGPARGAAADRRPRLAAGSAARSASRPRAWSARLARWLAANRREVVGDRARPSTADGRPGPARRPGRPARARRPTAGPSSSTSRPVASKVPADELPEHGAAGDLPARGRARRLRRAG